MERSAVKFGMPNCRAVWLESVGSCRHLLPLAVQPCTRVVLKVNTCHICLAEKEAYACDLCVCRECEGEFGENYMM